MKISDDIYSDVKKEYTRQLEIPRVKPKRQFILCSIGLVGSGKTTVLKPLSKKLNLLRISADEMRKLFKKRSYGYDRVKELGFEIADDFLKKGFSIAVDSDCVSGESQKRIEKAAKKFGLKKIWIHINPSEEFILKKLKNFKHIWLFKDAEQAINSYFTQKPSHANIKLPFIYTFDTSKKDIDKQIEKAAKVISENLEK